MNQIFTKPNKETLFLAILILFAFFALRVTFKEMSKNQSEDLKHYQSRVDNGEDNAELFND